MHTHTYTHARARAPTRSLSLSTPPTICLCVFLSTRSLKTVFTFNVSRKKQACLVHCSDGWDRTSQLSSLVQLLIDPACRTMKGFCRLIEKEWCATGHMFAKRCGAFGKEFEQGDSSPAFVRRLRPCFGPFLN